MDSKEKYYQYIMRDLLSKTIMEPFVSNFTPFWISRKNHMPVGNIVDMTTGLPRDIDPPLYVVDYMVKRYGVHDEDVKHLWGLYIWHVWGYIEGFDFKYG